MFRTPLPNEDKSRLETIGTQQLLGLFEFCLNKGGYVPDYSKLAYAWGTIFSRLYLSAEELVDEMVRDEHRLSIENESMLKEFIAEDCRSGGLFVLSVIKTGGNIDRAALFMIADLGDLAGVEHRGTTAIHLLADACDKGVRPAFLKKLGGRLLSSVYDARGIPVIYTIFALADLSMDDLHAVAEVFSEDALKNIMCRNRTGKDALTVFYEVALSLKSHAPLERHMFFRSLPQKDTGNRN